MTGKMSSGKRLIYVIERFPANTLNFVYNEIRVLEEAGFEIDIWSLLPSDYCPEEARPFLERTHTLRPVPPLRLAGAFFHYLFRKPATLLNLLLRVPFDNNSERIAKGIKGMVHMLHAIAFAYAIRGKEAHVHAHFAFKAATAAMAAARLNGRSFSFTAHGSATVHEPSRFSLRSKIRAADFIIAVSDFNKRVMLKLCPELDGEKIHVNRTGIMLADFPYLERETRREGPYRLLCTASLYAIKNHEGLLAACGLLARRGIDFRLDLVGKDQDDRQRMLEGLAADLDIAERVHFLGLLDHGRIAGLLADADLFVLTSHSEGIPIAVMEAMAVGTPVVAPRVTGLPELIREGESGWLVDTSRPESIAEAMELALTDPEARESAARGARETVEAKYDMATNAKKLAGVFLKRLGVETGRVVKLK